MTREARLSQGELFTVEEVAARLKVNPQTVREWIRSKRLIAVDLGRRAGYRVTAADLDRFLEDRKLAA
jgi:excisionase family DNA binding protein